MGVIYLMPLTEGIGDRLLSGGRFDVVGGIA